MAAGPALPAGGADFPARPVTLICPWPPGGATDVVMRALAEATGKHLGQPVVVENKPGGSGTVGPATMAATARPDGYTLSQIPVTLERLDMEPFYLSTEDYARYVRRLYDEARVQVGQAGLARRS